MRQPGAPPKHFNLPMVNPMNQFERLRTTIHGKTITVEPRDSCMAFALSHQG
jgi:hypothetical protein